MMQSVRKKKLESQTKEFTGWGDLRIFIELKHFSQSASFFFYFYLESKHKCVFYFSKIKCRKNKIFLRFSDCYFIFVAFFFSFLFLLLLRSTFALAILNFFFQNSKKTTTTTLEIKKSSNVFLSDFALKTLDYLKHTHTHTRTLSE